MVIASIIVLLIVIALTVALTVLGRWIVVPDPVLIAAAGIALSFVPVFPAIHLDPSLVLLVMLPPLVYSAAVELPWEEFRNNLASISLFAVGLVLITSFTVAAVAHRLMPEIGWAGAFALGSIVSPTDPVASSSVARRLGLPRRLLAILEGEGLVNDAVALTLLSLAATALQSHSFSIGAAAGRFTLIVVGETAYGLAVGWVAACIRQRLRDSRLDASISLITPFVAYLVPQALGGSGVLAVVAAGMYIGIRAPEMLTAEGRLSLAGSWNVLTFLLNGALFLLTGLQFRSVIDGTTGFAAHRALLYGAAVTLAVVVIRFVWTWPASWATGRFSSGSSRGSRLPDRQVAFLGWCGMRGGISLAAALSLPAQVPERSLIVFVTACVIAGTLIVQGAPLPLILRALRLDRDAAREAAESLGSERRARTEGVLAALAALDERGPSVENLREEYKHRLELLRRGSPEDSGIGPAGYRHERLRVGLDALSAERGAIIDLYRQGSLPEYVLHRIERDLDLREVRLRRLLPE